jgi:uncharacterized protein with GYD domain
MVEDKAKADDDTYIVLSKYTSAGRQYARPEHARRRWEVIEHSLRNTLKGTILSHHVTMGGYDSVVIFTIPPGQDFHLFQCLVALQQPGDVEITILRGWDFDKFAPR